MKKSLFSVLFALCLVLVLTPAAFAVAGTPVTATVDKTTVAAGETFTYSVKITDPDRRLGGIDATVSYDKDKLECVSAVNGGAFSADDLPNGTTGVSIETISGSKCVRAVATVLEDYDLEQNFITAVFRVKEGATGTLTPTLTVNSFFDEDLDDVAHTVAQANAVSAASALAITSQPTSVTANLGETVEFTVGAVGDGLTYQWQWRAGSSGTWKNTSAAGNKTATMTVTSKDSLNGCSYRCKITDANGTVIYSDPATLTVTSDPVITSQPKSVSAEVGETVKFSVEATGNGLTYQ